ncbi:relaxase domain-containing protein [Bradyrhizobium sp. Arg237L]|uniref:MobF family relaxase n=1 Tax=Bradyrhizobium sp. Arg237L TaxID=3003352 RepID=UPI00249F3C59|nr:MobF family relaxase [Bradyrhizobium sp. Arg237L]MDI4232485.1 relaxase domain-containing protein [Bradyrhizobium sp. Arg237L]
MTKEETSTEVSLLVTRPNKVFSAEYFTDEIKTARYFLADSSLGARWLAGDARFGVEVGAEVDADHLAQLFEGRDRSGNSLLLQNAGMKRRISAYELSVGVSKSVSAVWALAAPEGRAAIERTFAKSLDPIVDHIQRNAFTRLGHNGKVVIAAQPNICAFIQPDTRPVLQSDGIVAIQPQLHAHIVLPNLVAIQPDELSLGGKDKDVKLQPLDREIPLRFLTRSLDGQPIFRGAKSWGALQHLALATELQRHGYAIGDIGRNGTFEIVPPTDEREADRKLRAFWSQRRAEIECELSDLGLTTADSPELAARAAVKTRRAKLTASSKDTFARWREEAEALGIDTERYSENRRGIELELPGLRDSEIAIRMADVPERLTEFESTFDHHDLVREVASALVGTGVEVSRVDDEIVGLLDSGAIVEIGRTDRERIFSTPEMIRLEREIIDISTRLADQPWHRIDRNNLAQHCQAAGLSDEQTAAALGIADGRSIDFIEARSGTGKTFTLVPVCRSLEDDYRIIATGVSWRTARMLEDELSGPDRNLRVEARALDSWLAVSRRPLLRFPHSSVG